MRKTHENIVRQNKNNKPKIRVFRALKPAEYADFYLEMLIIEALHSSGKTLCTSDSCIKLLKFHPFGHPRP